MFQKEFIYILLPSWKRLRLFFFFIFLRTLLYSFNYQVKKQRNIPHFAIIAIQSSRDEFSREKVAKGDKLFPETRVMVTRG